MDTVTESAMAVAMAREGGIGIIHRFLTIAEQVNEVLKTKRSGSIIIENPYTIRPEQTLREAIEYMRDKGVAGLLVTDTQGKLVGILTRRDIIMLELGDEKKQVKEVMTSDVITAKSGVDIDAAKDILRKNCIEKLPLLDEGGNVKGLITSKDIINAGNYPQSSKDKKGRPLVGAAVGVKGDFMERTESLLEAGSDVIVVDIAHGHSDNALNTVHLIKNDKRYKIYRGMDSFYASLRRKSKETGTLAASDDLNDYVAEGVEGMVPYKGSVADIIKQLSGGIRSGLSYCGANNIAQMQQNAQFIKMSTAGYAEIQPHHVELM